MKRVRHQGWLWAASLAGALAQWSCGPGATEPDRETTRKASALGGSGVLEDVVSVSSGLFHTCALLGSGRVVCAGMNAWGQLGNGTATGTDEGTPIPVYVSGLTDAIAISSGLQNTCALRSNGRVVCWGLNTFGSLGNGDTTNSAVPVGVLNVADALQIAAGSLHTCAVRATGDVVCWGRNTDGQLGNGLVVDSSVPVPVQGLSNVTAVFAGPSAGSTCAVRDGQLWCWGAGLNGQLGNGALASSPLPVPVTGLADAVDASVAFGSACAVRTNGDVMCWGLNQSGFLGIGAVDRSAVPVRVEGISGAVAVSSVTTLSSCAVLETGAVMCWGAGASGSTLGNGSGADSTTPVFVSTLDDAVSVSVGGAVTCAARASGQAVCWGGSAFGQRGDGSKLTSRTPVGVPGLAPQIALAAEGTQICALDPAGQVTCWGNLPRVRAADLDVSPVALPDPFDVDAVAVAGTLVCSAHASGGVTCRDRFVGLPLGPAVPIIGLPSAVALDVGFSKGCAVGTAGEVACWNVHTAPTNDVHTHTAAVPVTGLAPASGIAVGDNHVCALLASGGVACWGSGGLGQLGDGGSTFSTDPVAVVGINDAVALAAADSFSCAVRATGGVECWGYGQNGSLGSGTADSWVPVAVPGVGDAVAIAASEFQVCVVRASGGVTCWGFPSASTPTAVPDVVDAVAVAVDDFSACALGATGAVSCWGQNNGGALGPGFPWYITTVPLPMSAPECPGEACVFVPPGASPPAIELAGGLAVKNGLRFRFTSVSPPGGTLTMVTAPSGTPPPTGYQFVVGPTGFRRWDFSTDFAHPGAIEICIHYDPAELPAGMESVLKLVHDDGTHVCPVAGGGTSPWCNITTSVDTANDIICGSTTSLSPFALIVPIGDTVPPVFGPGPETVVAYATSNVGGVVTYTAPAAVDAVDGPLTPICTPASGSNFPPGKTTVTCTATDSHGNPASAGFTVWVQFQAPTNGTFFLPPINADGSSVFKAGSTIPVKFQLTGASAAIGNLAAHLKLTKVASGVTGTDLEAATNGAANEGDLFRYDPVARQYIFNLSTKTMTSGTWLLRADLGDEVVHQINVSLKGSK